MASRTASVPALATQAKKTPSKKPKTGEKKKAATGGSSSSSSSHPSSAAMVLEAVSKMGDRSGASLQAIKKYIEEVHKVDMAKQQSYIKKALKKLVETGKLTHPKGTGASGSFKLAAKAKEAAPAVQKKQVKPKTTEAKKTKTVAPKKPGLKLKSTAAEKKKEKKPTSPKSKAPKTMKKAAVPAPKAKGPKKTAPKKE